MESHPLRRDLEEHLELNEKLARRIPGMKGKEKGLAHRDLNRGWKEVRRIERQMRDDILDRAQVLCCTCIGVGHQLLDGRKFTRVLLDEATQATEPASLVPLVRGARQIVLVGDHRQLPPTVISRRAENGACGALYSKDWWLWESNQCYLIRNIECILRFLISLTAPSTMEG